MISHINSCFPPSPIKTLLSHFLFQKRQHLGPSTPLRRQGRGEPHATPEGTPAPLAAPEGGQALTARCRVRPFPARRCPDVPLPRLVGRSVGLSVGLSVRLSVRLSLTRRGAASTGADRGKPGTRDRRRALMARGSREGGEGLGFKEKGKKTGFKEKGWKMGFEC